jgi:16S rRNA (cytosine967-C5)-methyltransferase
VFDRVLADVPCSGFGTLRKNPDLKWRREEKDVKRLSELQFSILRNLSVYVKKGGVLVYSTCTVFHEENEDVVEKFLGGHSEFQLDRIEKAGKSEKLSPFLRNGYFRTFPPRNEMDGFFVARMSKES